MPSPASLAPVVIARTLAGQNPIREGGIGCDTRNVVGWAGGAIIAVLVLLALMASAHADGETPAAMDTATPAATAAAPQETHLLPMTGAELARDMKVCAEAHVTSAQVSNWRACSGYFAGILNGVSATTSMMGLKPVFCLSDTVTDTELQTTIIAYIDAHPDTAAAAAPAAIIDALLASYPCK
jgi:hypothetical protein